MHAIGEAMTSFYSTPHSCHIRFVEHSLQTLKVTLCDVQLYFQKKKKKKKKPRELPFSFSLEICSTVIPYKVVEALNEIKQIT